jgi:HEAT repeat protein
VPFLRKQLESGDRQGRFNALTGIANSKSAAAVNILKDAYGDPDESIRGLAVRGMLRSGRAIAIPVLRRAMTDRDPKIRRQVAEGLADFPDDAATQMLSELITDLDPSVASQATTSLGKRKDAKAARLLAIALGESEEISKKAAQALLDIGSACFGALCEQIPSLSPTACERLVPILVQLDSKNAVEPLVSILQNSQSRFVLDAVIRTMANLNHPRIYAALLAFSEDPTKDCRPEAISHLQGYDDPGVTEKLVGLLSDRDPLVRSAAIDALTSVNNPSRMEALMRALTETDPEIVGEAARGLGQYEDTRILAALVARMWPEEGDNLRQTLSSACRRPIDMLTSAEELLAILGRLSTRESRSSEEQKVRPYLQALYILLRPGRVCAFSVAGDTSLVFRDAEFMSEVQIDRLHSFARRTLAVFTTPRALERWRQNLTVNI